MGGGRGAPPMTNEMRTVTCQTLSDHSKLGCHKSGLLVKALAVVPSTSAYCIAGNFRGRKLLWMVGNEKFMETLSWIAMS